MFLKKNNKMLIRIIKLINRFITKKKKFRFKKIPKNNKKLEIRKELAYQLIKEINKRLINIIKTNKKKIIIISKIDNTNKKEDFDN